MGFRSYPDLLRDHSVWRGYPNCEYNLQWLGSRAITLEGIRQSIYFQFALTNVIHGTINVMWLRNAVCHLNLRLHARYGESEATYGEIYDLPFFPWVTPLFSSVILWAFMKADDINDRMFSFSLNYWTHDICNEIVPEVIIFF